MPFTYFRTEIADYSFIIDAFLLEITLEDLDFNKQIPVVTFSARQLLLVQIDNDSESVDFDLFDLGNSLRSLLRLYLYLLFFCLQLHLVPLFLVEVDLIDFDQPLFMRLDKVIDPGAQFRLSIFTLTLQL